MSRRWKITDAFGSTIEDDLNKREAKDLYDYDTQECGKEVYMCPMTDAEMLKAQPSDDRTTHPSLMFDHNGHFYEVWALKQGQHVVTPRIDRYQCFNGPKIIVWRGDEKRYMSLSIDDEKFWQWMHRMICQVDVFGDEEPVVPEPHIEKLLGLVGDVEGV